MKIIEENKIYPDEETPVLEHYKENFDLVKICFLPFFKIDSESNISSRKVTKQISFEELKAKDDIFKDISGVDAKIYVSNENYPKTPEIIKSGKVVKWNKVISETTLENFREVNRALKTSIDAYKKPLRRFDLLNKLEKYTEKNEIWFPIEGHFDTFTKIGIYKLLNILGKNNVIVIDEFYEEKRELDLTSMTELEFVEQIKFKDYYIYAADKSILFAISWDDFFYFIATQKENLRVIDEINEIEGFNANDKDSHLWDWEEGEIEKILNKANYSKKEPWGKGIFKKEN